MLNYTNQHFLTNPKIAELMSCIADINEEDSVLEIGPGKGIITKSLLKYSKKVVAIEKDPNMLEHLEKLKEEFPNLEVIIGNALARKWPKKIDKLVANIPFNIIEPLIYKLIQERIKLSCLLVGEKYAQSVNLSISGGSQESRLALLTNAYFIPEIQVEVPSKNFYPEPSVNGAIITLQSIKKAALDFPFYVLRNIWDQHTRIVYDSLFNGVVNFLLTNRKENYLGPDRFYQFLGLDRDILQKRGNFLTNRDFFEIYKVLREGRIKRKVFKINSHLEEELEI